MRGEDLNVVGDAAFVAVQREIDGALGCRDGDLFGGLFLIEDAQCGEIVFDLLEGSEDALAVVGNGGGVVGAGLFCSGAACASVPESSSW